MWTTSSFRADVRGVSFLAIVLSACLTTAAAAQEQPKAVQPIPPDAPRAARPQPKERALPTTYEVKRPVVLRSVRVGPLTKKMQSLAGAAFVKTAKDPIFVEVKTSPGVLGKPQMASAPIILLNGERLLNTRSAGPDTLVAFLPDRERIKGTNSVAVVWIGKQEPTMTPKPLSFRREDVK
jgi:hypothetical protein